MFSLQQVSVALVVLVRQTDLMEIFWFPQFEPSNHQTSSTLSHPLCYCQLLPACPPLISCFVVCVHWSSFTMQLSRASKARLVFLGTQQGLYS